MTNVNEIAAAIKKLRQRASFDVVETGKLLTQAKAALEHGEWYRWLAREFSWSRQSADNFIRTYEVFHDKPLIVSVLEPTALYALSRDSTPPEAMRAVEKLIAARKVPTPAAVKKIIRKLRGDDDPPAPPPEPKPSPSVREAAIAEQFSTAVAALKALAARPSKIFAGAVPAADLELVANFLREIASKESTNVNAEGQAMPLH
jgi:hypothetical protein